MKRVLAPVEARFRAEVSPDLPAVAWGVWRDGETSVDSVGVEPSTPFALASVTKPMTATAVALLAERGQVDLDAPISEYLPTPLRGDREGATVRRVLQHRAGLPLHYQFFYGDEAAVPPTPEETIRRYGRTFWVPGSRYVYSNLGYGLLGWLIERVSGKPYAAFMRDELFRPLEMDGASIGTWAGAAAPRGKGFDYPPYTVDHPAASMAFANVEDLLRFGRFHLGDLDGPLTQETRTKMRRPPEGFSYGLGWAVSPRGFAEHTGSMGGVRTILRLVPSHRLVLALLTNGEDDRLWQAADEMTKLLAPDLPPAPPHADQALAPEDLNGSWIAEVETWTGEVRMPFVVDESFRCHGGRLFGTVDGDLGTPDAARRPYRLRLDLGRENGDLVGAVSAISEPAPDGRTGNALSSFARARRA